MDNNTTAENTIIERFSTRDIILATFLRMQGCNVSSILAHTRHSTEFIFENVPNALLLKYHTERESLEPLFVYRGLLRNAKDAFNDSLHYEEDRGGFKC